MPGYILIIDAMCNRRIHLRAQLDTAAYPVELVESQSEGLVRIRQDSPDVVIVADDLPGLRLRQFCKLLRTSSKTQLTTIVVAVQRENHSARISALNDGAYDVIEHTADAAELKARMRSFMRSKHVVEGGRRRAVPETGCELAEAIPDFIPKTVAVFVRCSQTDSHVETCCTLDPSTGIAARDIDAQTARRAPHKDTDVYVLVETHPGDEARETLGALLAHPISCHSRILFVTDARGPGASPLDLGAHDQVPSTVSMAELALRIQRLARLKRDAERLRKTTNELEKKAYVDALTGLCNRAAMDEYLIRTDRALAQHPRRVALLIADLDHFKAINDNHGHASGDAILAHVAQTMGSRLRDGDFIARYGGEEFLIVLPNVGLEQAKSVAHRLRNAVAENPKTIEDGTVVRATISIGLAVAAQSDQVSTAELRRAADAALYDAKRNGRNRTEVAHRDALHGVPFPKIKVRI